MAFGVTKISAINAFEKKCRNIVDFKTKGGTKRAKKWLEKKLKRKKKVEKRNKSATWIESEFNLMTAGYIKGFFPLSKIFLNC